MVSSASVIYPESGGCRASHGAVMGILTLSFLLLPGACLQGGAPRVFSNCRLCILPGSPGTHFSSFSLEELPPKIPRTTF